MATKWFRPYSGGPYGSNDGSSYANAYYRTSDIVLAAGDTLNVTGTHDSGGADGYAYSQIFRGASVQGTESDPIIIEGMPSGQAAGKIIAGGVNKILPGDWTDEGSGVWSLASVGGAASWLYNEEESWPNDDRFIFDHGSVPTSGDAPAFHKDGSDKLWYAPDTGTPLTPVWTSGGSFFDFYSTTNTNDGLFNPDHIHIQNLKIRNCSTTIRTMHQTGILLDNIDIGWSTGVGLDPRDGTEYLTLINSEIHNVSSTIYSSVGTEVDGQIESVSNCLIKNNLLRDYRPFTAGVNDCHGIGWQNGSYNRFTANTIQDGLGTGITRFVVDTTTRNNAESSFNEVDNNIVRRIGINGQSAFTTASMAVGIEMTGQ